jgi:hypothetical protein
MSAAPMVATLIAGPNNLEPNSFIMIFPSKSTFFGKTRLEGLVCLQYVRFKRHAARPSPRSAPHFRPAESKMHLISLRCAGKHLLAATLLCSS